MQHFNFKNYIKKLFLLCIITPVQFISSTLIQFISVTMYISCVHSKAVYIYNFWLVDYFFLNVYFLYYKFVYTVLIFINIYKLKIDQN